MRESGGEFGHGTGLPHRHTRGHQCRRGGGRVDGLGGRGQLRIQFSHRPGAYRPDFANRKYHLMHNTKYTTLVEEPDRRGMIRWDEYLVGGIGTDDVERQPVPNARFSDLDEPLIDSRIMRTVEKDFSEWCYQTAAVTVKANEKLGVYAGPDVSEDAFNEMCAAYWSERIHAGCAS